MTRKPPAMPPPDAAWNRDWSVGVRVWIERQGAAILGQGRADLLEAIDKFRSISAAARHLGLSYRHAWEMVQSINRAAGEPFVESATGGVKGGGARLTDRGRAAVTIYRALLAEMHGSAATTLARVMQRDELEPLHLMAAISLQETVGQLLTQYALARPAVSVRAVFGASNELADYLLGGTPADLFLSADRHQLDRLDRAGLLVKRTRRVLAANRLVVIALASSNLRISRPADLLDPPVERIVLADPACPLGRYSREFLQAKNLYDSLLPLAVQVDSSRGVVAAVKAGAAPVGMAFKSDVLRADGIHALYEAPAKAAPIEYSAAIVGSGHQHDEARQLLDFLGTPVAAACFSRCGLQPIRRGQPSRSKS